MPADAYVMDADMQKVADAIRTKGETTEPLVFPDGMVTAINEIKTGGGGTLPFEPLAVYVTEIGAVVRSDNVSSIKPVLPMKCVYYDKNYTSYNYTDANPDNIVFYGIGRENPANVVRQNGNWYEVKRLGVTKTIYDYILTRVGDKKLGKVADIVSCDYTIINSLYIYRDGNNLYGVYQGEGYESLKVFVGENKFVPLKERPLMFTEMGYGYAGNPGNRVPIDII